MKREAEYEWKKDSIVIEKVMLMAESVRRELELWLCTFGERRRELFVCLLAKS
jgi:hypothetical protein